MHSKCRTCALVTGLALLCLLCVTSLATAQQDDLRATVTVRVSATYGAGPTQVKAMNGVPLTVGETGHLAFRATLQSGFLNVLSSRTGSLDQPGVSGGIVGGVRGGGGADVPVDGRYTWLAQVRVISIETDAVKFEIDWSRSDETSGGAQRTAGDVRTIALKPGERHTLDFVKTASKGIANLAVDVEAARVESPAFADASFGYDLWLVHETTAGQRITRRLNPTGRQGELVSFSFDQMAFPVDATQAIDGIAGPVKMRVSGTLLGRVRANGTVELAVNSLMGVGTGNLTAPRPLGGSGGSMTFVTKPDETSRIELPIPNGSIGLKGDAPAPAALRPGVTMSGTSGLYVDESKFFAGSKTALVITVHRQQ